jgi:hypothetical protein
MAAVGSAAESEEMPMADGVSAKPPARGRPFEKGRSGNPGGRRTGSRNKATSAAAALLEGESETLTRKAVELALIGDPTAMRLCLERILPPCRERTIKFALPPMKNADDVADAMNAVTSALAGGAITPGEAATIASVVDTFVRAIETSHFDLRFRIIETEVPDDAETDDEFNRKARFCCRSAADAATGIKDTILDCES